MIIKKVALSVCFKHTLKLLEAIQFAFRNANAPKFAKGLPHWGWPRAPILCKGARSGASPAAENLPIAPPLEPIC